jgi:hypothetical protein
MKLIGHGKKQLGKIKNWTNGAVVLGIASLGSLGSVGTNSCIGGNCGSACGFKCIVFSTLAFFFACLKCRKRKKQ